MAVATSPPFLDAARLAIADHPPAGHLPPIDTVFVAEPTNRATPSIRIAERFLAIPGLVAVVGHSNSAASLAAAAIYNSGEVVQIAPTASATSFSDAGPFSFRLVPPDSGQALFLARHLEDIRPKGGRLALFYVNDDYGRGLQRALLEALDSTRFRVVLDVPHLEEEVEASDVARAGRDLVRTAPDVILWLARAYVLERFIDEFRRVLPDIPILGSDAVGAGGAMDPGSERWTGVTYVAFVDMDSPSLIRFRHDFHARFGWDPNEPCALTYDAVSLLLAGIQAGVRSGPEMRRYLTSLGRERPAFEGITGPIKFDDHGDVDRSYTMAQLGRPPT